MKNTTDLGGDWDATKNKLKQRFALLTENDLSFKEGNQEELLNRLQLTLGKTKEEIEILVSELLKPLPKPTIS